MWETTTTGVVWVPVVDERGRERDVRTGGKEGARLRLSITDREIAQERMMDPASDPFTNGLLRRVDADQNAVPDTVTDQALSTTELLVVFSKSGAAFQSAVRKLNEINVRRMRDVAETVDASTSQVTFLDAQIEERFRKHGSMPSYDELQTAP